MNTFFYAFSDELEKLGKIFGRKEPTEMYEAHPGIRHRDRMKEFKEYIREKGREKPTSRLRAGLGGAAIGAGGGALAGAAGGVPGALIGAGIGGGLGALTGLGLRSSDIEEIKRLRSLKGKSAANRELAKRLSGHMQHKESTEEMREFWKKIDREEHTDRLERAIRESKK